MYTVLIPSGWVYWSLNENIMDNSTIKNSYATGNVSVTGSSNYVYVGGLVGCTYYATISNCYRYSGQIISSNGGTICEKGTSADMETILEGILRDEEIVPDSNLTVDNQNSNSSDDGGWITAFIIFMAILTIVFLIQERKRRKRLTCKGCKKIYDDDDIEYREIRQEVKNNSSGVDVSITHYSIVEFVCSCHNCGKVKKFTKKFTTYQSKRNG